MISGYDLIEWLMDRLCIEDSRKFCPREAADGQHIKYLCFIAVEAVHLANLLCQFGYYFPVSEQKNLLVKDDSSLYRFQVRAEITRRRILGSDYPEKYKLRELKEPLERSKDLVRTGQTDK